MLIVGRFRRGGFAAGLFACRCFAAPNCFKDFASMYGYLFRCFHAETYLIATNFDHDDRYVVVDDNALVLLAR